MPAFSAELERKIVVPESSPARDIKAEYVVEVGSIFDSLLHHFSEGGAIISKES
jgi:hypothetical protein